MAIQVNVTATKVTVSNKNNLVINKGEYGVNDCIFTFSNEYEGLSKRAVFYDVVGNKSMVEIKNNTCVVPELILSITGTIYIGVFAFENTASGELRIRYSPTPDEFIVNDGSYSRNIKEAIAPETSMDLIAEVNQLLIEGNNAINRINSIRFEIDESGYLILIEND